VSVRRRLEQLERRLAPNPLTCECRSWPLPTIADLVLVAHGEEPIHSPRSKHRVCPRCGSRDPRNEAAIAAVEQCVADWAP
jgi:hypothetical protein